MKEIIHHVYCRALTGIVIPAHFVRVAGYQKVIWCQEIDDVREEKIPAKYYAWHENQTWSHQTESPMNPELL